MMLVAARQIGDQRTGIQQDRSSHRPYPSMYFLFTERSPGPSKHPARSWAKSRHEIPGDSPSAKNLLNASRTTADLLVFLRAAAAVSLASRASGSLSDK